MSDMYLKMLLKKRMLIVHSNTKYSKYIYRYMCELTPPMFRVCAQLNALEKFFKILQPYLVYSKIQSCLFRFSFRATLFFP